ncbi:protein inscuteable homolog [Cephus cinctus]|uniref:Protein inscuteable homolog n=1 Tax=Cephus cinctus TaxID=211228 RepID=A0AAJ7FTL1_CEPCN|nr:protein inscuteable homolog [Cephus cinctus]
MSGFKRHQSKVFWSYMASQDVGQTPFPHRDVDQPRSLPSFYCNLNATADDGEESLRGYDSTDGLHRTGNITTIRIGEEDSKQQPDIRTPSPQMDKDMDGLPMSKTSSDETSCSGAVAQEPHEEVVSQDRSYSPNSHGHRSQDSGFSDSERSESPGICGNSTPRRRRTNRPRDRRRSKRVYPKRLESPWKDNEVPPHPAHTSTPKQSSLRIKNDSLACRIRPRLNPLCFNQTDDAGGRDTSGDISVSSLVEECLGEFLYAAEPPEDADVTGGIARSCDSSAGHSHEEDASTRVESLARTLEDTGSFRQLNAVRAWLGDLAMETEGECTATLQSKALPRRQLQEPLSEELQTRDLRLLTSSATAAATRLLVKAEKFDRHYELVVDKVTHLENAKSERELLRSIEEHAFRVLSELGAPPPRRIQPSSLRTIIAQLESLRNDVDKALDTRLDFYIERVVRGLEEAPREGGSAARGALAALTALGLAGSRAGSSIARCSGVRALLTSLLSAGRLSSDLRSASLRALASVCCCPTAIEWFARDGGPEILVDLLAAESSPETEKMEAAALVVQVTAPWIKAIGLPHLEPFKDTLVQSLTRLAENTSCGQTLLLAAAALHHLSKSRKCIAPILEHDTVRTLLKCVKKSAGGNVWLMEQVASLIGELARIPETRAHLARARASVALVCFLRMRPPGLEDAYQRLEVTAAAALTRLCVDPEIARQVVAVGGADCLPSYKKNHILDADDEEAGLLKYTKSLRMACKKAAKQIDFAKACDYSIG